MTTVVFGPFIGEFAWELLYWQGWVRKVCLGEFRSARKIAVSVAGRQPFYPYVDEFWPLPDWFRKLRVSSRDYFTDGWLDGYPGIREERYTLRGALGALRRGRRPARMRVERPLRTIDVEPQASRLLEELRRRLPEEAAFFVPWLANRYEPDDLCFGVFDRQDRRGPGRFETRPIPFDQQLLEPIEPTGDGEAMFRRLAGRERPLLCVFPRHRTIRAPDKNWRREKYVALIRRLQAVWPELRIAVLGEPGGAYFADGVPEGCLDLINVPDERRMDIQVAALRIAVMALGGMSGAMFVAMACGCPTLFWGYPSSHARFHRENVLKAPMIYHTELDPEVDTVLELARAFRAGLAREAVWQRSESGDRTEAAA